MKISIGFRSKTLKKLWVQKLKLHFPPTLAFSLKPNTKQISILMQKNVCCDLEHNCKEVAIIFKKFLVHFNGNPTKSQKCKFQATDKQVTSKLQEI